MLGHRTIPWIFTALVIAGHVGLCPAFAQDLPPAINAPPNQAERNAGQPENYEALTRGPIHEAFANPYVSSPEAGLIVEKAPPELIEEIPPEAAPAGDNVQWIPGYWGWEPTDQNFIWVSGLWRNMPPERRWVPGYWTEVRQGFQWVSGFWSSTEERELSYLPVPPESLERGPNIASPDGDYFWAPGCWVWADNDYQWRPGYWAAAQEGWVWVPDHYTWTPYGVVFVNGYWDRDFVHRGTLFSPVRFAQIDPGFRYSPLVTIDPTVALLHLFVSRPYGHYRFGDYYEVADARHGILPWVAYERQAGWYDPLLTYYQWSYGRRGVDLTQRLTAWNQYFVQHEEYRPPITFADQRQFVQRFQGQENVPVTQAVFAQPLQEILATDEGRQRFRKVPNDARQQIVQNLEQFQSISQQRAEIEAARAAQDPQAPGQADQRGRLPRTLDLPQTVTALRPPSPTGQPQTTDPTDPQRTEQPGADRPERVRPPERPRPPQPGTRPDQPGTRPDQPGTRPDQPGTRPDQPGTRPDQPGTRPDQPGTRPDQPGTRPDQPGTRPDQPGTRPDQPGTRPDQPGTRPDRPDRTPEGGREDRGDRGERIRPFNFRRPDESTPRGETPRQPGQNPQQVDPRDRRGFESLPPGLRRPGANPAQPPAQSPGQRQPRGDRGQASPPPGNPGQSPAQAPGQQPRGNRGQGSPPPGNPGQASPPPGNPGQAGPPPGQGSPPPGNPGQAGPPPGQGSPPPGNPGQAGPPPGQGSPPPGNPGQPGPPKRGDNPPGRGKPK